MHSRRNLTILFVFALSAISMAAALAYDNLVSHPGLTEAAINLYQTSQNKTLSSEQTKAIIQGSVDEDADPRYLNHFYDPTTGQGLSGQLSARAWSQNQQSIIGFAGDYSEAAILKNYQDGDPTRAYQGIGHILHLIQDMSVPAHVRNDIHPNGDVYEVWVKQYGKINPTKYKLIQIENITNAFENIALATYQNFYSKNSINNFNPANYQSEKIIINNQNRLYYINNFNGIKYKLVYTQNPESLKPNYQVDDDFKLNLDYWNILSAQAVGYSAGVIGYFQNRFNQIDKVKVQTKVGFWQGVGQGLGQLAQGAKYVIGDVASLGSIKRQEIWSGTTKLAAETWQEAINYGEAVGETTTKLAVATVETGQTVAKDTVEITGVIIDKSAEQGKMLSQKIITTLPPPPKLPKLPQLPKLVLIKPAKAVGPVTASVKPVAKLPATILPITTTSVTTNNPIAYYFSPTPSPTPNPELPAKEATSTIIDLATSTATSTMATSTEAVPLTAIITSLATTTPQNILISWQVNEASSTSSSTAFDLAYTINSGEWQTYLSSTTATSTVYGATKPTSTALTYSFKVRAGESGQWSESQSIVLAKTDTCTPLESLITNGAINLTSAESPYCLHQELDTSADQSITIEPGVVIRFARNIKWHINGTVQAIGALGLPIVFTALTDVPNSQPKKGDWCGLDFQPGSMANFEYAEFKYGGWCSDIAAMAKSKVVSRKSNIRLAAQQVWQMYAAIDANDATITISRSVFKDNDSAIWSHGQSTVTVSHSRFEQNSIAILNDKYAVNPVEATNNWWGTDLGPRTFELQNQLDWNLFLGDITYEPWQLTAPIN